MSDYFFLLRRIISRATFLMTFALILHGCAFSSSRQKGRETRNIPHATEEQLAQEVKAYFLHLYGEYPSQKIYRELKDVTLNLLSKNHSLQRQEVHWLVLDTEVSGFLSAPAETYIVTVGLLRHVQNQRELAVLLAKILSHDERGHHWVVLEKKLGSTFLYNFRGSYHELQMIADRGLIRKALDVWKDTLIEGMPTDLEQIAEQDSRVMLVEKNFSQEALPFSIPKSGRPERGHIRHGLYVNEKFGFEFSLPPGWSVDYDSTRHEMSSRQLVVFSTVTSQGVVRGEVIVLTDERDLSHSELFEMIQKRLALDEADREGSEDIRYFEIKMPKLGWVVYAIHILERKGKKYVMSLAAPESAWKDQYPVWSKLINSWRWL